MPGYGFAHLRERRHHPDIVEYLERIQATLDPFHGRFIVHGPPAEVLEGTWPGSMVLIEFPDLAVARAWYRSPAYRGWGAPLMRALRAIDGATIWQADHRLVRGSQAAGRAAGVLGASARPPPRPPRRQPPGPHRPPPAHQPLSPPPRHPPVDGTEEHYEPPAAMPREPGCCPGAAGLNPCVRAGSRRRPAGACAAPQETAGSAERPTPLSRAASALNP